MENFDFFPEIGIIYSTRILNARNGIFSYGFHQEATELLVNCPQ